MSSQGCLLLHPKEENGGLGHKGPNGGSIEEYGEARDEVRESVEGLFEEGFKDQPTWNYL
jgi:hypothetical protein